MSSARRLRRRPWAVCAFVVAISGLMAAFIISRNPPKGALPASSPAYQPRAAGSLTFTKDIAPIMFDKCSGCHRPGQSGPFSLLTYQQVKARAKAIHEVVESRFMPPWLPEPGYSQFVGDRSLTSEQRGIIQQWLGEGALEGRPEDLPELPKWPQEWQLGPPDLIVSLPSAHTLPAEGKDIYRNFVVPIPGQENRYVRAVEFHPGNSKVVHHAFVEIDRLRQSRYLTANSQPPSFEGMQLPTSVHMPMGQMLAWQPGKPAVQSPEGLSWVLEKGSDLVLQVHLHPSGKPESVLPSVGFYFTDRAPTNSLFRFELAKYTIDIPAGERDYRIENSFVLPVDVDLLRINPHTHYLGKQLEGWAILPDGARKELLLIRNWDFNWQGDYLYQGPIFLPRGTTVFMRFSYDNSAENIHNPNQPPKRVTFGPQSTDEMGELWFQVLPRNRNDLEQLSKDSFTKLLQDSIEGDRWQLRSHPQDAGAYTRLGNQLFLLGQVDEALQNFRMAVSLNPTNPVAHSQLGAIYLRQNLLLRAEAEFKAVLRANPQNYEAVGSLGYIRMQQGRYDEARSLFEKALEINPNDSVARDNLKVLRDAGVGRPR